jgi:hypothetical protein
MAKSLLIAAPQVFLCINGQKIGRVTSFKWSPVSNVNPIYGLDSNEPFELAPTTTSCTGSMDLLKYLGDGGAEGAGLTPPSPDIPSGRYFSFLLIEQITNSVIFRADYCAVTSQSWGVGTRGMVGGTVNFQALSWSNEVSGFNSQGVFSSDNT